MMRDGGTELVLFCNVVGSESHYDYNFPNAYLSVLFRIRTLFSILKCT